MDHEDDDEKKPRPLQSAPRLKGMRADGRYGYMSRERFMTPPAIAVEDEKSELEDPTLWRRTMQSKVATLESTVNDVASTTSSMQQSIKTVSRTFWVLMPIGVVAAASFVITAYVAFARQDDTRVEQQQHEHTDIMLAHPGASEQLTKIREEQAGTRSDIQSFLREQEARDRRDAERLERIERQLEQLRDRRR